MPDADEVSKGSRHDDFDEAIEGADAVIMLRLQKERMASIELPDEAAYFAHYGLDRRRLARAAPGCLVMHPGPINRGIEIASDVADGAQSRILEQVGNGVFVRMAVLNEVLAR
jgi:aspartate carbamoyltransferase catalytic subunit